MRGVLVLVDNGFFKLIKKHFEEKTQSKKKFLQTFRNICGAENLDLKHLFVYMAPPFQSKIQSVFENQLKKKYDNIKKMLGNKKWVTVREGRCQILFDEKGNVDFKQKGVDSWIVADLCLFKEDFPDIDKIILITSDSDFAPIIKMIREKKGVEIILYTYFDKIRGSKFSTSNELLKSCSRFVKLTPEDFE